MIEVVDLTNKITKQYLESNRLGSWKYDEAADEWPYMGQAEVLKGLESLGYKLSAETLRRWQDVNVISTPSRYNAGHRKNTAAYRLFACAECYAAASLTVKQRSTSNDSMPKAFLPTLSLATISCVRIRAYQNGKAPILPRRSEIEKKIGRILPQMPEVHLLNLNNDPIIKKIITGRFAKYYDGCQDLWELYFMDGMEKFWQLLKKRNEDAHGSFTRVSN